MRSRTIKIRKALNELRKECSDWISYSQLADYIETQGASVSLTSLYTILREYNVARRKIRINGLSFAEIKFL